MSIKITIFCAILLGMEKEQIEQENIQNNQVEPTKKLNISTQAAIITAGALIALAVIFSGKAGLTAPKNTAPAKSQVPVAAAPNSKTEVRSTDFVRGDLTKADVVIIEYSDSDCPFCQKFHITMQDVLKSYGNKVAWIYRHFPLNIHPNAENEAIALECVGQLGGNETFWKYLDQVIDITITPDKSASVLSSSAVTLGIDAKLFSSCTANPATAKKVTDQSAEAQTLGARGTPYSVAISKSGEQVAIPGAYPTEEVKKIIDGLMK